MAEIENPEAVLKGKAPPKGEQKLVKQTKRKPKKEDPKKPAPAPAAAKEDEPAARRMKQTVIPGTERPKHKDIVRAAERLEEIVSEEKAIKKRKDAATEALITKMKAHGETEYREGDLEVLVTESKEKVTVRRKQLESADYE